MAAVCSSSPPRSPCWRCASKGVRSRRGQSRSPRRLSSSSPLRSWDSTRYSADRITSPAPSALVGCGGKGVIKPLPSKVVGTVKAEAPGKTIFIAQGCGSCHTYQPAGPDANGTIGPHLDKLPQYAKQAKQPLAKFVHDSIVDP